MRKTSLKTQLENEYKHRDFWDYYMQNNKKPFESVEASKSFIENFFISGSKFFAISEMTNRMRIDDFYRFSHTTNVFFIGVMLQRIIDAELEILSNDGNNGYLFSYFWFLTCLAHDLGYNYENDTNIHLEEILQEWNSHWVNLNAQKSCKFKKYKILRTYVYSKKLRIKHVTQNFWDNTFVVANKKYKPKECNDDFDKCKIDKEIKFSNKTSINRPWYSRYVIDAYFYYRIDEMRKLDHGIVGADKFYSGLVENYIKEFKYNYKDGDFNNFINKENKHFHCEQFKVFAYICDCIASHNIFMANEEKRAKYMLLGLANLLPEKFRIISYYENPLLFILCVADTLEPTKKFKELPSEEVLDNISIEVDKKGRKILVHIYNGLIKKYKNCESDSLKEYINSINSLKTWCDVEANVVLHAFDD